MQWELSVALAIYEFHFLHACGLIRVGGCDWARYHRVFLFLFS